MYCSLKINGKEVMTDELRELLNDINNGEMPTVELEAFSMRRIGEHYEEARRLLMAVMLEPMDTMVTGLYCLDCKHLTVAHYDYCSPCEDHNHIFVVREA